MHNACSYKSLGWRLRLSICILKSRFNIWVGVASANVHVHAERLNTRENCNVSASKRIMLWFLDSQAQTIHSLHPRLVGLEPGAMYSLHPRLVGVEPGTLL